jgi:diguanylate cyclase (GGDEF)-like protein
LSPIADSTHPVTLAAEQIAGLLERHRRLDTVPDVVPMHTLFEEILRIADRFVPSEAGSVLIDDPTLKLGRVGADSAGELIFVACYGDKAKSLLGRRIQADRGLVGRTYTTGRPYIAGDVRDHDDFDPQIDAFTEYLTRSIIAVPIQVGRSTCGVLELINHRERGTFLRSELHLLQIFAGYISTSLQNMLDANRYREMAKRDDLTGLYNDRYFNQRLTEEIGEAEHTQGDLSLVFIDLDHFKTVNDKHGHLVGSQTLREVALILSKSASREPCTVARYGGDEFVIIFPGASLERGAELAETIRQGIGSAVFRIDPHLVGSGVILVQGVITASIGVASYHELGVDETQSLRSRKNAFIRAADRAMYDAKERGKNRVCVARRAAISDS